ncbi:hypothetical protein WR25_06697 [Diploscapter pachys]|uniref:Uncharacterized protein n=1 Tax=Diploscapter pachys TaxID=2018661 RepID=A0A2A2K0U2_9BILA|nr:hypothetical protein WR25_06697 [Diploscapter pachys]
MEKDKSKALNRSRSTVRARERSVGSVKDDLPYEITIAILGGPQVGKSAIASQFLWEGFVSDYKPTVEEFNWVEFEMTLGGRLMLQIIDSSGSRDFIAMRDLYMRTADAFIIVFSVDDPLSFEEAKSIIQDIKSQRRSKTPIILLANKKDLFGERSDWRVKGIERYAINEGIRLMECTAKRREEVDMAFRELLEELRETRHLQATELKKRRQSMPTTRTRPGELINQDFDKKKHTCAIS